MKKIGIYARSACTGPHYPNVDDQIKECKAYAEKNGGQVVAIYSDAAASGLDPFRPCYQELLQDIGEGKF